MDKPQLESAYTDDVIYVFYRLLLPAAMFAIVITGHLWGLPDEAREFCTFTLGLCIKATFGHKD